MKTEDARSELGALAASLRVYLEWHQDSGTVGFVRRARPGPAHDVAAARASVPDGAPPVAPLIAPSAAVPEKVPPGPLVPTGALAATATAHGDGQTTAPTRLAQLAAEVAVCTRCGLASTRTQTVFARGNPEATLCFVGEAPGAEEDAQGLPFVGRAGQLLDRMISAMGLSPERDVYVCNILKCRPPGNRRPEPEEIATCIPYLHEQLALVRPRVVVAMGNTAVAALLDTKLGITKLRGQWKLYRGHTLLMPTYHPSYLLRPSPQQVEAKRQAWQDLQLVMKELGLAAGAEKTNG